MKRRLLFVGLGVLALAVGAFWMWGGALSPAREAETVSDKGLAAASKGQTARLRRIAEARPAQDDAELTGGDDGATHNADASAAEADLSAADRRLLDDIQSALDDERISDVRRLAAAAQTNPAAEVRQRTVEALGWFGEKALGDLTPFLADADDDVRDAAMGAVEQALAQVEDEREKVAYAESVMSVRGACTADGLEMLAGQLKGVADESAAVAAAVRVIESGANPPAAAAMREVYEFLTGEPYTTPEAAAQWQAEKAAEDD